MKKLRRSSKKRIIFCCLLLVILFIILHPSMNGIRTYDYIEKSLIYQNLFVATASNYVNNASIDCDYHDILYKETTMSVSVIDEDVARGRKIKEGGEYSPECRPKFSTAIIVPYRFVLPYLNLFGGAIAIVSQQFKDINGMSNKYFGWGGEDDDFYIRIETHGLKICRFEPDITVYQMQKHPKVDKKGKDSNTLLKTAKERMKTDGLNTLNFIHIGTVLHPLFTHIMVDL